MSSAIGFNLNQSKILSSGNGLTLYPTKRRTHNKSIYRPQHECHQKMKYEISSWKILWAKEKMLVTSIFSFSYNVNSQCHLKLGLYGRDIETISD